MHCSLIDQEKMDFRRCSYATQKKKLNKQRIPKEIWGFVDEV